MATEVGRRLAQEGVLGRLALDFVAVRRQGGGWETYAIKINLRKGGTTRPFLTLQFLTDGTYDPETGVFKTPSGQSKCSVARGRKWGQRRWDFPIAPGKLLATSDLPRVQSGHDSTLVLREQGGIPAMSRFLIELPHEADGLACARFVRLILTSGSHFLTHADWGCKDGVHSGWIIVEVDSKEEARSILPPPFRSQARIVALNYFTLEEIDAITGSHPR